METIRSYIVYRYPNWMDYARHMARVHHFNGWAEDLLHDIICDLLKKPDEKLLRMINAKTKKLVNGQPTTELDKFVLHMLKLNASSQVAPFRKNTLGLKITARSGNKVETQHSTELNGFDAICEDYDPAASRRLDDMHRHNLHRLENNGFNKTALKLYRFHFIKNTDITGLTEAEQDAISRIRIFLTQKQRTIWDND